VFDEVKAYEVKAYKKVCHFLGHPVKCQIFTCHIVCPGYPLVVEPSRW